MCKRVDPWLATAAAAIALGLIVGGGACNNDSGAPDRDRDPASGGARSGGAGGAADDDDDGHITGSGGAIGSGGAAAGGASSGGTTADHDAGGGRPAASGGAGGRTTAADARPADAMALTGGSAGSGGSQPGSGGSDSGGASRDAAADAGPDALASRDAAMGIPDAPPIPDLPTRRDVAPDFWPGPAPATCTPTAISGRSQSDGHHRPGEDCMRSGCHLNPEKPEHHAGTDCRGSGCHANGSPDGSGAPAFLFGGTVYRAVTLAADPGVEVAVQAASGFYSACSAANGNFWVVAPTGTKTLTWTGARTRLRNANGEAPMMTTPAAGCNATACHTGNLKMTSP